MIATKELLIKEINTLPPEMINAVYQFVEFQKHNQTIDYWTKKKIDMLVEKIEAGEYVSDDEYLSSIPGMMESIKEGANEPPEKCIPYNKNLWNDL